MSEIEKDNYEKDEYNHEEWDVANKLILCEESLTATLQIVFIVDYAYRYRH